MTRARLLLLPVLLGAASLSAQPVITSLSPSSATAGAPAFDLVVRGTGFSPGSAVRWNATTLPTVPTAPGVLTARVTAARVADAGAATVTVRTFAGATSEGAAFTILPAPVISTLSPASAAALGPGFSLTVAGANFVDGDAVTWNGAPLPTTFGSASQLTAAVGPAQIASAGTALVRVRTPDGVNSGPSPFTVAAPPVIAAVPAAISSLSPPSAVAGGPAFTLTVTGTDFDSGATVLWSGTALATTVVSPTQLTAAVDAARIATPGAVPVTVQNSDGSVSPPVTFTITAPPAAPPPAIISLSPSSATAGGAAFTLTINGSNFVTGAVVLWNGDARPATFVNAGQLTTAVPAAAIATAGSVSVAVRNPDGGTSAPASFTISAAPSITSLSPASVTAGAAQFTLTVNGASFASGAEVRWNGTPLATTFVNAGRLTAIVAAARVATAGTADVTVRNPDGAVTAGATFTVNVAVSITTDSPLPGGVTGTAYSQTLQATGGTPPYTWSVSSGAPPAGITLSGAALSGTPTGPGTSTFTVRVTDAGGGAATKVLSLTVASNLSVTTASLPNGSVGAPYSQTLAAAGGTAPYTWAVATGSLPARLTLATNGAITGTPSTAGPSTFTVRVTDSAGATATRDLSITIAAGVAVTTATLPPATQNSPYSQALQASGGNPPYTWALAGGALPAGVTLTGGGALAGTPTVAGTFNITVRVTDSLGGSASRELTLTVASPVEIVTEALARAAVSAAYSQTLSARGGAPPYTWSVAGGALPDGLALSPQGVVSGTPGTSGEYSVTVKVADSAGAEATRAFALTVSSAISIAGPANLALTSGAPVSVTFTASGGSEPYTWSVSSGALPPGIDLGGGVLSGVTAEVGIFDFTIQVSDGTGGQAAHPVKLVVNPPLAIVTTSLDSGIAGVPYSQTLQSNGGTGPFAWTVASGSLPPGLALNGPRIEGSPTAAGSFAFTLRLADANGAAAARDFSIAVGAGLSITTTSLPNAAAGIPYAQTVTAAGGAGPYTWAIASGTLPAGLTLSAASGSVTGTPTTPGVANFMIQASDTTGTRVTQPLVLTVAPALSITTASLPAGATSAPYSQALTAAGGTPPYVWSIGSGALPPGLDLNPSGAIGGTPGADGDFSFTARVTDSAGASVARALTIHIGGGLAITAASPLQAGRVGAPYLQTLTATGGLVPYRWALAAGGALPPGLALEPTTGVISGTPTATGTTTFSVQVTDAAATVVSRTFSLTIGSDLAVQTTALPGASTGTPYSVNLTAVGGRPPYTWSVLGGAPLPAGLVLDPTGTLHGTPTQPGPVTFIAVVRDSAGAEANMSLTLTIAAGLAITTADLPAGALNAPYNQAIAATGGTPPYTWAVSTGALPAGLALNPSTGALTGVPTAVGVFQFTVGITDAVKQAVSRPYSLTIAVASGPDAAIGGVADAGQPLEQSPVQVGIAAPFPVDITGVVTLDFKPEAAVPADDKAIAFSNGQRTIAFRIPAGQTQAQFPDASTQALFQNGTVAGTITATASLTAGGAPLSPGPAPRQMRIAPGPPVIRTVRLVRTAAGFEVWTTGFATTREITDAAYTFERAAGSDLQTTQASLQIGPAAQTWYQDPGSAQWGSQFTLVQPFSVQGNANAITAVSVTLRNAQGTSQAGRAAFTGP